MKTVYRIIIANGHIEFELESDAIAYRDANYAGCQIVVIEKEITIEE